MRLPEGRAETHPQPLPRRQPVAHGFTLLELMIVCAILSIIAGMGVPQYLSALRTARIGKARHELVTISNAIAAYQANNGGHLPLTLYQAGFGGRLDPWGLPYCYLNYADGTGDGLEWAIKAGLVDPSAVVTVSMGAGAGGAPGPRLAGFLLPSLVPQSPGGRQGTQQTGAQGAQTGAQGVIDVATSDPAPIGKIVANLVRPIAPDELAGLTGSLVSGAKVYTTVPIDQTRRRDRYLFPLNTDYDLFSLGPNGLTSVSLGESLAQDDVIRANNGGFFGTASEY
ncbi:MAG TPA: prepilin-type N-terminal cleavage/methylation domain-containing protein [Planctomycetota bacterium]|nr:prepilin-type N-terminal cleavage/methylation domain-containing protein [Planctomycetota bacterium]